MIDSILNAMNAAPGTYWLCHGCNSLTREGGSHVCTGSDHAFTRVVVLEEPAENAIESLEKTVASLRAEIVETRNKYSRLLNYCNEQVKRMTELSVRVDREHIRARRIATRARRMMSRERFSKRVLKGILSLSSATLKKERELADADRVAWRAKLEAAEEKVESYRKQLDVVTAGFETARDNWLAANEERADYKDTTERLQNELKRKNLEISELKDSLDEYTRKLEALINGVTLDMMSRDPDLPEDVRVEKMMEAFKVRNAALNDATALLRRHP